MTRSRTSAAIGLAIAFSQPISAAVWAQSAYPAKPIRVVVPFAPGAEMIRIELKRWATVVKASGWTVQ